MPNLLTLKTLKGVHFVDRGAAIGARVLFLKRAAQERAMSLKETILKNLSEHLDKILAETATSPDDVRKAVETFIAKQGEGLAGGDPEKLLEQALGAVKDESTKAAIMAAVSAMYRAMPPKAEPIPKPSPAAAPAAEGAPKEAPVAQKNFEEVIKGLDEKTRALIDPVIKAKDDAEAKAEEAGAENEKLSKRLTEVEGTVAEEVTKRELSVETEVAKSFPHVPGEIAKRAALLMSVRKNQGDKAYADLVQTFKAAEVLIAKTLPTTKGTSRGAATDGGTDDPKEAYEQLKKKAAELVEKSGGKITVTKAQRQVNRENPELYMAARQASTN